MAGGIVTALIAAIPGLIDLVSMSDPQVKRIGIWHMIVNLVVVAIFAANLWLRMSPSADLSKLVWLSVAGVVLLCVSGWLGGEMVYVHGAAVEPKSIDKSAQPSAPRRVA